MGENGDFFQGEMGDHTGKMGKYGGKWGKYGKIYREKGRNTLGRTCFQAPMQREVVCDMPSLAALHCIYVQAPGLTRVVSLWNCLRILHFLAFCM